ncbi:tyrosine-type recombinase/integrase [Noviherbaspirillum autotrophicum]|uniref:Integrase n=1 Tax=Noviherbaspirillum autotrophicum TaxID=709839 RepID=A0A0C2BMP2_9BURK|nr:integrase arm-type DNA-binding domain-containing protein [Noviherbaspirillum autotrophicum]KIF81279.1 integrase [Noviherbaspirillum autotrophicum]
MPLTDTAIRNAKPVEKAVRMFDGGGLYLEIAPSGGKWWRLKYRFDGKEKRLSLGTYPEVGLKEARDRRDAHRKLLANGIDPSDNRKAIKAAGAERAANSFETVAREWLSKNRPGWAPSHYDKILSRLENDVFPYLGKEPIAAITPPELLTVIRRIEGRGALETAHRALANCGQVFRYAVATGRAERDHSADLRGALPSAKSRRKHFAAVTDPKQVAELLRALDGYQGSPTVCAALRLAPLVFVRPSELRSAEWAHIDLEAAEWRYTVSKTKTPHIVSLSTQAVAILREIQPLTGNGRYVFPSPRTKERPMSDNAILSAMRRMGIDKEMMSGHGFRAMARTLLDEVLAERVDLIEHQLAHAVKDPNGRAYNRTSHLAERKRMMQRWADYLDQLKDGADVIALPISA